MQLPPDLRREVRKYVAALTVKQQREQQCEGFDELMRGIVLDAWHCKGADLFEQYRKTRKFTFHRVLGSENQYYRMLFNRRQRRDIFVYLSRCIERTPLFWLLQSTRRFRVRVYPAGALYVAILPERK